MIKGDIGLFELPFQGGHEQAGTRPAIIISVNNFQTHKMLSVVPFTSQLNANSYPDTCIVKPSSINGLSNESVALVFQLRAISSTRFKKKLGNLEQSSLFHIEKILRAMLGL